MNIIVRLNINPFGQDELGFPEMEISEVKEWMFGAIPRVGDIIGSGVISIIFPSYNTKKSRIFEVYFIQFQFIDGLPVIDIFTNEA